LKNSKLFVGIISRKDRIPEATQHLEKEIGKIEKVSPEIPFEFTKYYEKEFGEGLFRVWVVFEGLVEEEILAKIKKKTISIEEKTKREEKRSYNLDPGVLTLSKLVLATTKNYAHRVALGDGLYAEVTLIYRKETNSFVPLPWTYPDYKTDVALRFFNNVRRRLKEELRNR